MVLVPQGTGRVDRCQHWFLWLFLLLTGVSGVNAAELMSSADVMEGGKWSLNVYGRHVHMEPVLTLTSGGSFQLPAPNATFSVFPSNNADLSMDQDFEAAIVAVKFRPHNGLTYRVKAGQIRSFDLEFSSGSDTNKLEATDPGLVYGLGVEWNVSPGSIVSPAITLDGSWTQTRVDLDRFESPGVVAASEDKFQQDEIQLALNVSKRFKEVEPFGGMKVIHLVSRLKDDGTKESLRGSHDGWAPFVGLQWEFFPGENLVVEGSFVDDRSFNAGLNIRF